MNLLTYQPRPEPKRNWRLLKEYNPLRRYVARQHDPHFDCLSHYYDNKVQYDVIETLRQYGGTDGH